MINVTKTYLPNEEKYKSYISQIFQSGRLTNRGELVIELERRLENYLGVSNIILVSNGTLALNVSYKLLNLKGSVLTTPFSFVATTSSIAWEGLRPRFTDINENTLNMCTTAIESNLRASTSAIVPVHVFGNGCAVEEIDQIAEHYNLKVIYDAAHAFGVKYKGESILKYGDISTLSFHATKIFHTIEGGAIIVKDDDLYNKGKRMIDFGINGPDCISHIGINAKMNEFQAAMGLCVLDDIEEIVARRHVSLTRYEEAFCLEPKIKLQQLNPDCTRNYQYFPIILESEELLLTIKNHLAENGVFPRRYFYPSLDTLEYTGSQEMPVSRSVSSRILCLPLYDSLATADQNLIIRLIKEVL